MRLGLYEARVLDEPTGYQLDSNPGFEQGGLGQGGKVDPRQHVLLLHGVQVRHLGQRARARRDLEARNFLLEQLPVTPSSHRSLTKAYCSHAIDRYTAPHHDRLPAGLERRHNTLAVESLRASPPHGHVPTGTMQLNRCFIRVENIPPGCVFKRRKHFLGVQDPLELVLFGEEWLHTGGSTSSPAW